MICKAKMTFTHHYKKFCVGFNTMLSSVYSQANLMGMNIWGGGGGG